MKLKLIMVGLMVIMALSMLACSSSTGVSKEVSIDDFMNQKQISEQVEISAGSVLTVILGSNPSTGFRWTEEAEISNAEVLKQASHEFVDSESDSQPAVGTAGQESWTFDALKAGTATISLEYSRPWEGGEQGEWTYTLTVTVK